MYSNVKLSFYLSVCNLTFKVHNYSRLKKRYRNKIQHASLTYQSADMETKFENNIIIRLKMRP